MSVPHDPRWPGLLDRAPKLSRVLDSVLNDWIVIEADLSGRVSLVLPGWQSEGVQSVHCLLYLQLLRRGQRESVHCLHCQRLLLLGLTKAASCNAEKHCGGCKGVLELARVPARAFAVLGLVPAWHIGPLSVSFRCR